EGVKPATASDVYSLGTVFYQLLYGKPMQPENVLFSTQVINIVRSKIIFPTEPNRFGPHSSVEHVVLEGVCRTMLDRDPRRRPSAKAISQSFGNVTRVSKLHDELLKSVEHLIRQNAKSWFSPARQPITAFADYLAFRVVKAIDEDDALALLRQP